MDKFKLLGLSVLNWFMTASAVYHTLATVTISAVKLTFEQDLGTRVYEKEAYGHSLYQDSENLATSFGTWIFFWLALGRV